MYIYIPVSVTENIRHTAENSSDSAAGTEKLGTASAADVDVQSYA